MAEERPHKSLRPFIILAVVLGLIGGVFGLYAWHNNFTDSRIAHYLFALGMPVEPSISHFSPYVSFEQLIWAHMLQVFALPPHMPLAQLDRQVQFQASFISYLDVFHRLGILALVVWPIALLLNHPPAAGPLTEFHRVLRHFLGRFPPFYPCYHPLRRAFAFRLHGGAKFCAPARRGARQLYARSGFRRNLCVQRRR